METTFISLLRCPRCRGGPLHTEKGDELPRYGPLTCGSCRAVYPVSDGIVDLLPQEGRRSSLANRLLQAPAVVRAYERRLRPWLGRFPLDPQGEYLLLRSLLAEGVGGPLLDLSCGTGHHARALAKEGIGQVFGVDRSLPMLREARHHLDEEGAEVALVRADAGHLPFVDEAFGAVLNAASFHLYDRPLQVLEEVVRVLRPGGVFVCSTLRSQRVRALGRLERRVGILRRNEDELRHLFALAGLEGFERVVFPEWFVIRAKKGGGMSGVGDKLDP